MRPKIWRYVAYWHTWRRYLGEKDGLIYEIEITPVNPSHPESWAKMGARIYAHCTPRNDGDLFCRYLPPHVEQAMRRNLQPELVELLWHADFFSNIDFERFKQLNNGGVDFRDCCKPLQTRRCNFCRDRSIQCPDCAAEEGNYQSRL